VRERTFCHRSISVQIGGGFFFALTPLYTTKFLTADILFHNLPPTSTTSDAHNFFATNFSDTNLHHPQLQKFAITSYLHGFSYNPITPPSLSPQYLHPPNETIAVLSTPVTTNPHSSLLQQHFTTINTPQI